MLLILATACVPPRVDNRGHVDKANKLAAIHPGATNKQEVLSLLGSPSTASSFGDDAWYYISSRRESVAFFRPEVEEQHVTRIQFDASGVVKEVTRFDGKDSRELALAEDITPTEGQEIGLWEQLLGNFGRFNKPRDPLER